MRMERCLLTAHLHSGIPSYAGPIQSRLMESYKENERSAVRANRDPNVRPDRSGILPSKLTKRPGSERETSAQRLSSNTHNDNGKVETLYAEG
jgi:hypothetical protein